MIWSIDLLTCECLQCVKLCNAAFFQGTCWSRSLKPRGGSRWRWREWWVTRTHQTQAWRSHIRIQDRSAPLSHICFSSRTGNKTKKTNSVCAWLAYSLDRAREDDFVSWYLCGAQGSRDGQKYLTFVKHASCQLSGGKQSTFSPLFAAACLKSQF